MRASKAGVVGRKTQSGARASNEEKEGALGHWSHQWLGAGNVLWFAHLRSPSGVAGRERARDVAGPIVTRLQR